MLRVIGGKYRGQKLMQPARKITRPTMDRVKEAIFNIIQLKVRNSIVLDLFAGSGALGIEAASRGAIKVIAVDNSSAARDVIQYNLQKLKITNVEFWLSDVVNFVKSATGKKFDLIFVDPPFANFAIYNEVLSAILETKILKKYGLIILETSDPKQIKIPTGLVPKRYKKYGTSHVLLLANNI